MDTTLPGIFYTDDNLPGIFYTDDYLINACKCFSNSYPFYGPVTQQSFSIPFTILIDIICIHD